MAFQITEKCIGCTLCARNCPMGAISGKVKEQHRIRPDLCVDCGVCGKACPAAAILDDFGQAAAKVDKKEWEKAVIDPQLCYGCSLCIINCHFDCIAISKPKFHGDIHTYAYVADPKKCVGCGLCVKACPVDAVWLEKPEAGAENKVPEPSSEPAQNQ